MSARLKLWLRLTISAGLLTAVFVWIDPILILRALVGINPVLLFAALALVPVNIGIGIAVWLWLLRAIDNRISTRDAVASVLAGHTMALFTPARLGEIGARLIHHSDTARVNVAMAYAAEAVFRMATATLGGAAALYYLSFTGLLSASMWWWLATGALLAGIIASSLGLSARHLGVARIPESIQRKLSLFRELSVGRACTVWLLTASRYTIAVGQFTILLFGTGISESVLNLGSGASFVLLAKSWIPNILFLDLGVREGAAAFVFNQMGDFGAAATAAAIGLYALNVVLPALVGIPFASAKKSTRESVQS
jgi:Lysylphosphatidylglycerol synthase TM region